MKKEQIEQFNALCKYDRSDIFSDIYCHNDVLCFDQMEYNVRVKTDELIANKSITHDNFKEAVRKLKPTSLNSIFSVCKDTEKPDFKNEPELNEMLFTIHNFNKIKPMMNIMKHDPLRDLYMIHFDDDNIVSTDAIALFVLNKLFLVKHQNYEPFSIHSHHLSKFKSNILTIYNTDKEGWYCIYDPLTKIFYYCKSAITQYPNYKEVLPESFPYSFTISKSKVLSELDKLSIGSVNPKMYFDLENGKIAVYDLMNEVFNQSDIHYDIKEGSELMELWYNYNYITSILKNIEYDMVTIQYSAQNRIAKINSHFYLMPIMPANI